MSAGLTRDEYQCHSTGSEARQNQLSEQLRRTLTAIRAGSERRTDPRHLDQMLRARRRRRRFFGEGLFADPAWDMLLELYAAELGQRRVSVSSLCLASDCPDTTALRYINRLCADELIRKEPDRLDARRRFVYLTPKGLQAMNAYMSSLPAGGQLL